eukprot:Gb_06078 [translate_table: standard]
MSNDPENTENSGKMESSMMDKDPSEEFSLVKGLGQGNMSRVFLAVHRGTNEPYAMKVMNKEVLRQRDAFKMASMEKDILSTLDHPFLPTLLTHFESDKHTFLAMKYCSGGDINVLRHRQPNKIFSESATRFYAAEIVLALEYLHKKGIVYRDLKPENILVQDSGHIMLTDFDLSLRLGAQTGSTSEAIGTTKPKVESCFKQKGVKQADNTAQDVDCNWISDDSNSFDGDGTGFDSPQSHSFVGTKEYIAPEILWCTGHAFPVDWWSFGILLYEMVHGRTPFSGANRKETFFNILCRDPLFTGPWSVLQDLIEKLLVKEPSKRLGTLGGAEAVKQHQFFHGLKWDAVEFVCRPPFVPPFASHEEIISGNPSYDTTVLHAGAEKSHESHALHMSIECLDIDGEHCCRTDADDFDQF